MATTSSNRRIAKNTAFLYGRLLLVLLVSLYTVRVVLNALGVVDYGVYNVVGGFVSMFGFLNTSMANATQRFYNFEIGKNGQLAAVKVYNAAFRTQSYLAIFLVIICEVIGVWYVNSYMEMPSDRLYAANFIFQFSIISLAITILQVPFAAATMAYEKMDFYALIGIVDVILKLCIAIFVIFFPGDRLILYGGLLLFISLTNYGLYFVYIKKNFPWLKLSNHQYSRTFQKKMLAFSGWNLLGSFAFMLRNQGLTVLLNFFFGVIVNAANGIATQISSALQQFSTNLIIAFKPQLVQSYAVGEYSRTREMLFMMSKTAFALLYMLTVPLILNMNYILHLWLGADVPDYTVILSNLVIITVLINCLHTPIVQVIHATGNIRSFQIGTSVIICAIIPLSWLILKCGGAPESCYMVCIVVYILNQIYAMRMLKNVFNYKYTEYLKNVIYKCAVFCVLLPIMPALSMQFIKDPLWSLVLSSLESLFISALLFLFILLNHSERHSIISIIRNKFKIQKS